MSTPAPYAPTPFTTAIVNPSIGGSGTPYPYLSVSQYRFAPTAVDVDALGDSAGDAEQALADVIRRASAWADRICFGADPAAKGASLCATLSVESAFLRVLGGELRLVCDYKPIIQVNGIDVGPDMGSLFSIGSSAAASVRIGRRTIYVPLFGFATRRGDTGSPMPTLASGGSLMAVWSYVNGYPHTMLASNILAGDMSCTVLPTDGGKGTLGIIQGTQLTVVDGAQTERFTVSSVSGTTVTSTTPLLNNHTVPPAPDAIPVTALPADVPLAVEKLTSALIKTQGDASVVLDEMKEPREVKREAGDMGEDVELAMCLLKPFRVSVKAKR